MYRLAVEDLGKRFGRRVLFRRMGFVLEAGESMAITGHNGSGKSTLLRILAGVMTPTRGAVRLWADGEETDADAHPLHVGLVAPYLNVYDAFTARENLGFIAKVRRLPRASARIGDVLSLVSLSDRADDLVGTFSSGMKQRVKYAAALITEPPVLLLDEPSANLDAAGLEMVDRVMDHQREQGGVLIVATNVVAEARRHARRLSIEDFR